MTDQQYQIGLSTLFIGYVLMQVPSNAMLNYAGRPSIYIGFFVSVFPYDGLLGSSFARTSRFLSIGPYSFQRGRITTATLFHFFFSSFPNYSYRCEPC